ncbi:NnrU family protein [Litorivita sp. NS0012-18]|uniref:NnrU family protein n=1 Tax=Litorivita sp. NS0012-18 TaxID=3127655 RepID=UPI0031039386
MTLLVLGIAIWIGAHLLKRLAPDLRASMGEKRGRGIIALALFASLALMIIGFRGAPQIDLWYPPAVFTPINNLLMLLAVFLFAVSESKGALRAKIKHPQLYAVKTWAVAHLLVNGDLASVLLFGGMLFWAVVSVILINRSGDFVPKEAGPAKRDIITVLATLVAYAVIVAIHSWLGYSPFA